MTLDRFDPTSSPTDERSKETSHDKSAAELFASSALYELHQSAVGLAQTVGLQDRLPQMEQPEEAESWGGRQLQMLGRGFGSFIPSAGAALVSRYGVGKVIEHLPAVQVADNVLLKRSVIGLSATESVATGVLTGALFKPTDAGKVDDWKSFLRDRTESAVSSGIAFGVTSVGTFGWSKFAASAPLSEMRLSGFLKSAPVAGAVSGVFGGVANAESSSLVTDGKLTFDGKAISQSIYEMSVTGGLFGLASSAFGRSARDARTITSVEKAPPITPKGDALPFPNVPTLDDFAVAVMPVAKTAAPSSMDSPVGFSDAPGKVGPFGAGKAFENESFSGFAAVSIPELSASNKLALPDIKQAFGADSHATNKLELLSTESNSADLTAIAKFVTESTESRVKLINRLAEFAVPKEAFRIDSIEQMDAFNKSLSDRPELAESITDKLFRGGRWHQNIFRDMADFVNEDPGKRIPILSSLAEADLSRFRASDLLAAQRIHEVFEHDQPAVERIVQAEYPAQGLTELAEFIDKDVENRAPLVAKISAHGDDFGFHIERLADLDAAQKLYGLDSKTFDQLTEFDQPSTVKALVYMAATKPELVENAIHTLHELGLKNWESRIYNIDSVVAFTDVVARDPSLFDRLKGQPLTGEDLTELAHFSKQSVFSIERFKALLDLGVKPLDFYQLDRLTTMLRIFGAEPELLTGALNLQQTQALSLSSLHSMLGVVKSFGQMLALRNTLRQAVSFTGAAAEPSFHQLIDSYVPPSYFKEEMPLSTAVNNASRDWREADAVIALAKFVEDDPGRRAAFAAHLVNTLGEEVKVTPGYLLGSEKLFHSFAGDDGVFMRLAKSFAPQLGSISDFIDKNPVANRQLILDELDHQVIRRQSLSTPRLDALVDLNTAYGADSHQLRALRSLESTGVSLASINKFVRGNAENQEFLAKLLDMRADSRSFKQNTLNSLQQLGKALGEDSPAFARLLTRDAHTVLEHTLYFLKGDYEKNSSIATTEIGARTALLAKVAGDFEHPWQLSGERLQDLLDLQRKFGNEPQTMANIMQSEASDSDLLHQLKILSESEFGAAFVRHSFDKTALLRSAQGMTDVTALDRVLKPGPELAKRFVDLVDDGLEVGGLTRYLKANSARIPIVQELLADGASARELSGSRLEAIENIDRQLADEPELLAHLAQLDRSGGVDFAAISAFLRHYHVPHVEMLRDLVAEKAPASEFVLSNLLDRDWAKRMFADKPDVLQKLLERRADGVSLNALSSFSDYVGADMARLIEKLIEENAPAQRFQYKDLVARSKFANFFALNSPAISRLMELTDQGLDVTKFTESLAFRKDLAPAVEAMVNRGAELEDLKQPRLTNIASLYKAVELDPVLMDRLDELRKQGLDASEVGGFVSLKPDLAARLRDYVRDGFSVRELNPENITDLDLLHRVSSRFDPSLDAVNYLQNLQRKGLQGAQLVEYVRERPEERPALVEKLISEKADVSMFKDLMRLTAFPDDIAITLLAKSRSGGMPVTEIVRNLSSWEYGAAFERLVRARATERKSLDAEDLRALAEQAKSNPDISGEDTYHWRRDIYRHAAERDSHVAETLKHTADRIDALIPKDKPIVLLGRDTWPLVPILRERGHDTQYFLWGRNNGHDKATYDQWMKEVKPGSVVIDSGYTGSVINWIKERDRTASGLLMSRNNDSTYDQILTLQDHSYRVGKLEDLVKLINRSKSFTENGGVLVTKGETVDGTVAGKYRQFTGFNRWSAQSEIRDLLRASGLPEWYVWRYGNYVGMTPQDRLGLDSRSKVEEHYKQVESARKRASEPAAQGP